MWYRHSGDSKWHTGKPDRHSFCTLCDGRWSLTDVATAVIGSPNPPIAERCTLCVTRHAASDAERTEVHMLVDYLLMAQNDADGCPPLMGDTVAKMARELRRLRVELEDRTNELHVAERELAEAQQLAKVTAVRIPAPTPGGTACLSTPLTFATTPATAAVARKDHELAEAFVEVLKIAGDAAISTRDRNRLRVLARLVPQ